jgi:ABC-2 type transport system permease protein
MQEMMGQKDVLVSLVRKNLTTKYAGSFLGILWAFINPLLLALIIGFVFTQVFRTSGTDFYLFIIAGMFPWTFFATSLHESAVSVPSSAAVLKQFSIPRMFIPLAVILANFIIFGCGLLVLLPFFIMVKASVIACLPLLLLTMALFFLFTTGFSFALSAWCVESRDINQFLGTLLMFWLWLTPVFYSMDMVPEVYRAWFAFNPVNLYMELFRSALLWQAGVPTGDLLMAAGLSFLSVVVGFMVFKRNEKHFLKRI